MKEHECIHTNSRPYVCGVNGCQMRFRQRGKLSLHRRKHKGYKMKEYTLIGKNKEFSDGFSETETLLDKSHQDFDDSHNDASELIEKHIIPTRTDKLHHSRSKRKNREESSDTDSEFELPTYTTKKCAEEKKRSNRQRKASMKRKLQEDSLLSSEELEPTVKDEVMNLNNASDSSYDIPNSNLLTVPHQKIRKESYDSTLDGSHCGPKHTSNIPKGPSGFKDKALSSPKPNPNFETLVKAFKICQNLSIPHSDLSKKCEERKFSNVHYPLPVYPSEENSINLNTHAKFLNLSLLDRLQNGMDVNKYFSHLREQFNF